MVAVQILGRSRVIRVNRGGREIELGPLGRRVVFGLPMAEARPRRAPSGSSRC